MDPAKLRPDSYPLPAGGYRGCLVDRRLAGVVKPVIVWRCPHRHHESEKSAVPGRGPTLTSALDCARAELARRAEGAVAVG